MPTRGVGVRRGPRGQPIARGSAPSSQRAGGAHGRPRRPLVATLPDRTSVRNRAQRGRFPRVTDDLSRILAPDLVDDVDVVVEGALRPRTLDEYIGQREVKANLSVLLAAAKGRGEAADHVLLYGPPGLGKTTLATIIARELGVNVRYTSGPAVERAGDLAAILTALDERDVLFIDEIHRLNRAVEEILYPAMEDYALDVMIGKGPSARSLRLSLKPFTVVGATTRAGRISSPLRDRFGATYRLDFYEEDDLAAIVDRSARILDVGIDDAAARAIARRGRGTPRIVNRLLKRTRDHAQVHGNGRVDEATATAAMRQMEIDDEGLDGTDRKLLAAIIQKFGSGPVGVQALAAVLAEEVETIEDVYEPFLLRLGFLDRTPQGRIATESARIHLARLGYEIPPPRRPEPELVGLWDLPQEPDARDPVEPDPREPDA
ncbi:MAG: Holliday junction branch migration DNA helicase RuvB [Chloroflexi bacterium]|nr:Holliday junction branch migration DNA helicase RuvB [Chloroflexota bacterium]